MPSWKKVIISGSDASLNTLTVVNGITGSLYGTASWAENSKSASYVNTLTQNVLITGSLTVGTTSTGVNENTLTLGPRDNGSEGGQLMLQAPGGTYTSASMWDNYANQTRLLRGTNAGSDAVVAQFNMHTRQVQFPAYNNVNSFTGSAAAFLAVDTSGNLITTSSAGGGGGVTITNNVDNYIITGTGTLNTLNGESNLQFNGTSLTVTGQITSSGAITSQANNAMYFRGGDDAEFWDINVANTVGIYGQQNSDRAGLKLGSSGPILFGSASKFGIDTITPTSASLTVNGNVWANSFTGSLYGTASWSQNTVSASFASTASYINSLTQNVLITGSLNISGSLNVLSGVTGSLYGTASWANSSSFALTASYFAGTVDDLGVSPLVVVVATTTALPNTPVYGNGTLGIGAFLSGSVNGSLGNIDSTSLNVLDRILVKNQTSQLQNGVYEVTQTGSAVAKYILTRTTDADETSEFDPQVVIPSSGSVNKGLLFAQGTDNPIIGTSNITYTQTTTTTYVTQGPTGTQTLYNIPWWLNGNRQLSRGTTNFQFNSNTSTLTVTGSVKATSVTSSLFGTASWARNAQTSSYVLNAISSSFSQTASYLNTLNQNLVFNGNLTLNGTASISYLNVIYETASVIYSSGSNQFGDATTDIQTLIGTTIVSGGLQVTGSVNANSFTGSLFGTASWAQNAISTSYYGGSVESASYAQTASYINTLYQDVFLTGSLFVSNSLNTFNKSLIDDSDVPSLRWNQRALFDATNTLSIDWQTRKTFDSSQLDSIDWRNRWLYNSAGTVTLDWQLHRTYDTYTSNSIDWTLRDLFDGNGNNSINWNARTLYDQNGVSSADWTQRLLYNNAGIQTLDWQSNRTYDSSNIISIDWGSRYLYDTNVASIVAVDYSNRVLYDATQTPSIYWDTRALYNATATTYLSWANNIIINGSGSATPLFTVQGSLGNLFSVTDSLSGSLFSVNDISGLPILEVFSDNNTLIGDYQAPMLVTTKKIAMTNSGSFTVFSLPTSSYDTAFFEYSIKSGSNARAGTIMAIQSGIDVNFTETTTTDFGNTSGVTFSVGVSGSYIILSGSAATGSWTIKSIIRGL